jgi:quercetin dioxygenase-like cupin family protein
MGEQQKETPRRTIPAAEVVRLVDFVSYQEGSVVSRVIVKRDTGNVTLFAFDQGQGLSEHTAPFDALAHVIEGEAEIVISGKLSKVKAGEMVVMPANQPHALSAAAKFKMLLTMIRS